MQTKFPIFEPHLQEMIDEQLQLINEYTQLLVDYNMTPEQIANDEQRIEMITKTDSIISQLSPVRWITITHTEDNKHVH